jgi:hypothetical protein
LGDESDRFSPEVIEHFLDKAVRYIACGGTLSLAVCAHMWVPDKDHIACMNCKDKFTLFNRRVSVFYNFSITVEIVVEYFVMIVQINVVFF